MSRDCAASSAKENSLRRPCSSNDVTERQASLAASTMAVHQDRSPNGGVRPMGGVASSVIQVPSALSISTQAWASRCRATISALASSHSCAK